MIIFNCKRGYNFVTNRTTKLSNTGSRNCSKNSKTFSSNRVIKLPLQLTNEYDTRLTTQCLRSAGSVWYCSHLLCTSSDAWLGAPCADACRSVTLWPVCDCYPPRTARRLGTHNARLEGRLQLPRLDFLPVNAPEERVVADVRLAGGRASESLRRLLGQQLT